METFWIIVKVVLILNLAYFELGLTKVILDQITLGEQDDEDE